MYHLARVIVIINLPVGMWLAWTAIQSVAGDQEAKRIEARFYSNLAVSALAR